MSDQLDTVLGKAIAILRSFTPDDTTLSLSELVRRTGLPKPSVHRIAGDLASHRLLDRTGVGYRLSGGLFELGLLASVERSLLELAMPFLQDLYERTHEIVHLGIRDGHEVIYVVKIGGHRQVASPSRSGGRMPMHCTAIGKALLAHADPDLRRKVLSAPLERRTPHTIVAPGILSRQLTKVLQTGIAFEHEESAPGLLCVAAPVIGEADQSVAAISIAGPVGRFTPESHAAAVRAAAQGLGSVVALRRSLLR